MKQVCFILFIHILTSLYAAETSLPAYYEELTAPDFISAVELAGKTCVIPLGILEKHGPHLPLGTDLLDAREIARRAAQQEYTIIFPAFYFGQIYEAKHQPGTIAYSPQLVWNMLQETCDELARNGIKKIVLLNGHGGNNNLLPYFCQTQLAEEKDYAVVLFQYQGDPDAEAKIKALRQTDTGGHADEEETSMLLVHRPELVHTDRAGRQSGADLHRLDGFDGGYTGIWWYAKYPNHYAGDGSVANEKIGHLILDSEAKQLAQLIKHLKSDDRILDLQRQFYLQAQQPLQTRQ